MWGLQEVIQSQRQNPHQQNQCPYRKAARELACPSTMRGHSEKVPSINQKANLHQIQSPESAGGLIKSFSASRIIRSKFLLFIYYPVYGTSLQQPEQKNILNQTQTDTHTYIIALSTSEKQYFSHSFFLYHIAVNSTDLLLPSWVIFTVGKRPGGPR